jgi:transposase
MVQIGRAIHVVLGKMDVRIIADRDVVQAAIIQPWSNGQTKGQITKLKLAKLQMYRRAKIDLLETRVIGPAYPIRSRRLAPELEK